MSKTIKFVALTFSEGLNVLVSFLFLPYLARSLDKASYGTYGQTILIVLLIQGFFALGLSKVIFSYLANGKIPQNETLYSNIFGAFIAGVLAALLSWIVAPFIASQFDNPDLVLLIRIFALSLPLTLIATSLNSALIFFDKVKSSAAITVFSNLMKVLLIVAAIQFYNSLLLAFLAIILALLFRLIFLFYSLPSDLKKNRKFNKSHVISQIKSGWPLGVASILGVAFYSTDGYMVSTMLGVEEFAIYRNGAFQIPFVSSIYGAVTAILLPDVSKYFFNKEIDKIVLLKRKVIANTAMIIFPIVIFCIFFAKPLITIYLSEKYLASYPIFMVYNIILLSRFTSYDDLFIATDNNNKMPIIYLWSFLINVILNLFMIKYLGPIGAAIASVISFFFLISFLFSKGTSFLKRSPIVFFDFRKLGLALFISISLSLVFLLLSQIVLLNSFLLILVFISYLILAYHFIVKYNLIDHNILLMLLGKLGKNNIILRIFNKIYVQG